MIKLLQMSSFVIDDKIIKESASSGEIGYKLLRCLSRIYKPIAWFRLKYNLHYFLLEYSIWKIVLKFTPGLIKRRKRAVKQVQERIAP
jgi:hypothetical protein